MFFVQFVSALMLRSSTIPRLTNNAANLYVEFALRLQTSSIVVKILSTDVRLIVSLRPAALRTSPMLSDDIGARVKSRKSSKIDILSSVVSLVTVPYGL